MRIRDRLRRIFHFEPHELIIILLLIPISSIIVTVSLMLMNYMPFLNHLPEPTYSYDDKTFRYPIHDGWIQISPDGKFFVRELQEITAEPTKITYEFYDVETVQKVSQAVFIGRDEDGCSPHFIGWSISDEYVVQFNRLESSEVDRCPRANETLAIAPGLETLNRGSEVVTTNADREKVRLRLCSAGEQPICVKEIQADILGFLDRHSYSGLKFTSGKVSKTMGWSQYSGTIIGFNKRGDLYVLGNEGVGTMIFRYKALQGMFL